MHVSWVGHLRWDLARSLPALRAKSARQPINQRPKEEVNMAATPVYVVKRVGDRYVTELQSSQCAATCTACMAGGVSMAVYGTIRGGLSGLVLAALGAGLAYRGLTGHNPLGRARGGSRPAPRRPGQPRPLVPERPGPPPAVAGGRRGRGRHGILPRQRPAGRPDRLTRRSRYRRRCRTTRADHDRINRPAAGGGRRRSILHARLRRVPRHLGGRGVRAGRPGDNARPDRNALLPRRRGRAAAAFVGGAGGGFDTPVKGVLYPQSAASSRATASPACA